MKFNAMLGIGIAIIILAWFILKYIASWIRGMTGFSLPVEIITAVIAIFILYMILKKTK